MPDTTDNTLQYYEKHAADFADQTASLDMRNIQDRFIAKLAPGARIMDFGCGSGRDSAYFIARGFEVDAMDGSAKLRSVAAQRTGLDVRLLRFEDFSAADKYDGIWACASILHLPSPQLKKVLRALGTALRSEGVLYASFKYGQFEGERDGRYFTDMTAESFERLRSAAVRDLLVTEEYWITADVRADREKKWLNLILRRS